MRRFLTVKLPDMGRFCGFGVAGYRTLAGAAQWIPLDAAVTVFLGGNNSGKSNILRLLHIHMGPIFHSLRGSRAFDAFDPRVDSPRSSGDVGLEVHWPLDVDAMWESGQLERVRHDLEQMLKLPQLNRFGLVTLPFTSPSLGEPLEIQRSLLAQTQPPINWEHMSWALMGTRGPAEDDALRVLSKVKEWCIAPPESEFVPPSRAITGGEEPAGDWDFSGRQMIHQLQRLKAPAFDEDVLREREQALTRDLRILLEDDSLEFSVPPDRSTVNFRLGGQWFPLESLGTGTEHAVVILAARHVFPERLLCLEEPDAHLHPRLQRRLISLLRETEGRRLAVATHSAHMIDAADTVVAVRLEGGGSSLSIVGDHTLFAALRDLGYRASDLLQTNCIIWVEGPSDRIYLLHWLSAVDPSLVEGVDFSVVFYGGALLARLSAEGEGRDDPSLVDLWSINRRMWMVMDSDKREGELKPGVTRLQEEIARAGAGGTWITSGYTIENYVDPEALEDAVREVHPSVEGLSERSSTVDPLAAVVQGDGQLLKRVDKVAIALTVCEKPANLDVLDLRDRMEELARFIRESPSDPVTPDLVMDEPSGSPA